jgi:hypothetical protein
LWRRPYWPGRQHPHRIKLIDLKYLSRRFPVGFGRAASVVGGEWVYDLGHFGNSGHRDAAQFGVPPDRLFAFGQVSAEGLVAADIAVLPLNAAADLLI